MAYWGKGLGHQLCGIGLELLEYSDSNTGGLINNFVLQGSVNNATYDIYCSLIHDLFRLNSFNICILLL